MRKQDTVPEQPDLFGSSPSLPPPPGFRYEPDFISAAEEQALVGRIETLPLQPFEFHGFKGNRRVASFGFRYDYGKETIEPAPDLPAALRYLLKRAAWWAGLDPGSLRQILVSEYRPGAPIGWHTDKPQFDQVLGVSLLQPANFRLRRRRGRGWERRSVFLAPHSIYLLSGEVRREWQHSIPPAPVLRYSITLRSLAPKL
jgi:alkylated DNA repair dioxygenase AlkB